MTSSTFYVHNEVVEPLKDYVQKSRHQSHAWPANVKELGSLGAQLISLNGAGQQIKAEYFRVSGSAELNENISAYDIAVYNWLACIEALGDPTSREIIEKGITPSQMRCLILLLEWWCCPPGGKDDMRDWVLDVNRSEERKVCLLHDRKAGARKIVYHRELFALWVWEFIGSTVEPAEVVRQYAAEAAAAHRTALSVVHGTVTYMKPVSGCFNPCPWLGSKAHGKAGYPYYLWDIQDRKTIKCPQDDPKYLVVSHTWGRWRQDGSEDVLGVPWKVPCNSIFDVRALPDIFQGIQASFDTRYVWFDLVCIPQDGSPLMRDEIAKQTSIFSKATWAAVWFNRVDGWSGLEAAVKWMSLCYLEHTTAIMPGQTMVSCSNMNLEELDTTTGLASFRPTPDPRDMKLSLPYYLRVMGEETTKWLEPDGWFTSLWTLQEACLRPDLYICDKNWQPFRKCHRNRQAITLDAIVALYNATIPHFPDGEYQPLALAEIVRIIAVTVMHRLFTLTPINILVLGNQRYCHDSNRAVAIMSALGTLKWYQASSRLTGELDVRQPHEELIRDFVDRRYPLVFLNEVLSTFGGVFFFVNDTFRPPTRESNFCFTPKWHAGPERLLSTTLRATMLPFHEDVARRRIVGMETLQVSDHPSIKTWNINADGSVSVCYAAIAASCCLQDDDGAHMDVSNSFEADVVAFVPGEEDDLPRSETVADLNRWLESFRPEAEKYAIELFRYPRGNESSRTRRYGVLLERVYGEAMEFIKFGIFSYTCDNQKGGCEDWPEWVIRRDLNLKVL